MRSQLYFLNAIRGRGSLTHAQGFMAHVYSFQPLFKYLRLYIMYVLRQIWQGLSRNIWSGSKFGPAGQHIFGPPPPQTVLREAHAFRSVKARVTISETAREMCADENEDLVEKACLYLFDGRYLRVIPATKKKSHQKKGLTLRDGEVFYKPPPPPPPPPKKKIRLGKR